MKPKTFINLIESGTVLQQYMQLWSQAHEFFSGMQDSLAGLPDESPDRSRVEAALGVVNQFKLDDNASDQRARETAMLMADRLSAMIDKPSDQSSGDDDSSYERVHAFIHKLSADMQEFHSQTHGAVDDEEDSGGEGRARRPHITARAEKETDGPRDRDRIIRQEITS